MNKVTFKEITNENLMQVVKLSNTLSDAQKRCVATNDRSLAQAYVNQDKAWPRAIYLDETPIGFIMLNLSPQDIPKEDHPALDVWRLMIGGPYQSKGYGKQVLDLVLSIAREKKMKTVYLSCDMEGPMPYQFYIKYGFIDTGIMDEDEEILKIYV
ncbi:MAG: GNAT family N-acetyltransferase [Acholeplasmataceae bacterium]|nr:GNAT family N-acetyltransferase [Acholeplasmataceae bacterium]